jgi:hypothetical protein
MAGGAGRISRPGSNGGSVSCWPSAASARAFGFPARRPQHPQQDTQALEAHKENFAALVGAAVPEAAKDKPLEVWWQDEARVGQQGTVTYVWAERGSRPRDLRYQCLFGAVCPARGVGAALVLPTSTP